MTTLTIDCVAALADLFAGTGRVILRASERRRSVGAARAATRTLRKLSDHQRRDIGLTRDQIAGAARKAAGLPN